MTRKQELFERLRREMIVAVVREESAADGWNVARTLAEAGLPLVEITMTTPEALAIIERLAGEFPATIVAAGTVMSGNDAADARSAGATMLVSPHTEHRVLDYATEHDLLCVAGAATPTEIVRAWEAGSDVVKIYPAAHLGGPEYIRTVRQPIRNVPMLAGGPIALEVMDSYFNAGAIAVNLGAALAPPAMVAARAWDQIAERAVRARRVVEARNGVLDPDSLPVH